MRISVNLTLLKYPANHYLRQDYRIKQDAQDNNNLEVNTDKNAWFQNL